MKKSSFLFACFVMALLCAVSMACNEKEGFKPPQMPGTPNTDYIVSGKVCDEKGMPLKRIHVVIYYEPGKYIPFKGSDDIYTESDGTFTATFTDLLKTKIYIELKDENGAYESYADYFEVKYTQNKEYWYKGNARVSAYVTLYKQQ